MKRLLAILTILLGTALAGVAQDHRIYAANDFRADRSNVIVVKWVADQITFPGGFNVYRRTEGETDWQQLNAQPIAVADNADMLSDAPQTIAQMYQAVREVAYDDLQESGILRGFIGLNLLRNEQLPEALGTVWYDQTAQKGQIYVYRVEGLMNGTVIPIGATAPITAGKSYVKLPVPQDLNVIRNDGQIEATWKINEEQSLAMLVEVSENGRAFKAVDELGVYVAKNINEQGEASYSEVLFSMPIEEESTLRLRFTSIDLFGQRGTTSQVFAFERGDETPPPPPSDATVALDAPQQMARITWSYDDKPADFVGFQIMNRSGLDEVPVPLLEDTVYQSGPIELIFPLTGTYLLSVAALDETGNFSESEIIGVEVSDFTAPDAPEALTVTLDQKVITLNWQAPDDPNLLGYYVYRYLGNKPDPIRSDFVVLNSKPYTSTSLIDTLDKVLSGNIYYTVSAIDSASNRSDLATPVAVVLPDELPPAAPVMSDLSVIDGAIAVAWYPNINADLQSFGLYRSDSATGEVLLASPSPEDTLYIDKAVQAGRQYSYWMSAMDRSGNQSERSKVINIALPPNKSDVLKPIRPRNVIVKYMKNKQQATLWWEQLFSEDNLGVVVYKGETEDDLKPVSGLLKRPEFIDPKVRPGMTYYYQIRTYASNGAKDYSSIKALTIKADK